MNSATQQKQAIVWGCAVFFLCSLILSSYSARNPEFGQFGIKVSSYLLSPFQYSIDWVYKVSSDTLSHLFELHAAQERLIEIELELDDYRKKVSQYHEIALENQRLKKLIQIRDLHQFFGIAARVVGWSPTAWNKTVTIGAGSSDDIELEAAVLSGEGVAGRVIGVAEYSARVLLITDPSSSVDVLVGDARIRAIATGAGSNLVLEYVAHDAQIEIDMLAVASGTDGIFPKGILVGKVIHVGKEQGMFRKVTLEPAFNMSNLEEVFVIKSKPILTSISSNKIKKSSNNVILNDAKH
jgi:rod shape-determining protein MreC